MVQIGQFPHGKHEAPVVVFSPTAKALQAVRPCHAAKTEEERQCNNGRELLEVLRSESTDQALICLAVGFVASRFQDLVYEIPPLIHCSRV
jgi:hypothetical protein